MPHRLPLPLATLLILATLASPARSQTLPNTGIEVPELAAFDREITALMTQYDIPGGALAISYRGRLVLARGYGYADVDRGRLVQPWTQFRIASVSKPITAAAVLQLHEEGRLDIDHLAVDYLGDLLPPSGPRDPRAGKITIRDLLQHSGGWDAEELGVDMQFDPATVARSLGVDAPPTAEQIVRYALDQPLQFDPGTKFAYANAGYTMLARIIERVTGRSYEEYVRDEILRPAGVACMQVGGTLETEAARGETRYYDYEGAPLAASIYDETQSVPWPYGGFDVRALDAAGGWIASVVELMKFLSAVDGGATRPDILTFDTVRLMVARPAPPLWADSPVHYALGWLVRGSGASATWWHTGGLPGTASLVIRLPGELNIATVFNSLPPDEQFYTHLNDAISDALRTVTAWPAHDLFGEARGCPPPVRRRAAGSY